MPGKLGDVMQKASEKTMIGNFMRLMVEGFLAPRTSARHLLDAGHGLDVGILLFILAFLITGIFEVIFGTLGPTGHLAMHVVNLLTSAIMVAAMTFLAYRIGRAFGGTAELLDVFLVMAWHALVTSFLWPFVSGLRDAMGQIASQAEQATASDQLIAPGISTSVLYGGMFALILSIWLLANYIAEAHRFKSTWGVLGVLIGLPVVLTFVVATFAGAAPF